MSGWGQRSQFARLGVRAALAGFMLAGLAAAASVGPDSDIVIGTHVDLSGPLASWGVAVKNGLTLAIEEANAADGIDGRKLRLVVRDDGYDAAKAAAAVRELATGDRVFAVLSPLGTPTTHSAMNEALSRGIPYLFPISASEEAYLPPAPLKFSLTPSHAREVQEGLRRILNGRGAMKVGVLSSDDEFGRSVRQGAANELQRRTMPLTAEAIFAPAESAFEAPLEHLRRQGVELVVLGTEATQALQVIRVAAAMHWNPLFLCSSACYESEFATLAGGDAEGLYAVSQVPIPYPEDRKLGAWVKRYEDRFATVSNVHALTAYRSAHLFLAVLRQAGPDATAAQFSKVLETRGTWTDPVLGGLPIEFSGTDHLGSHTSLLSQIRRGRWAVLADPVPPPPLRRQR